MGYPAWIALSLAVAALAGCQKPAKYSEADYNAKPGLATEVAMKCSKMAQNEQNSDPDCASAKAWSLRDRPSKSNDLPSLDSHDASKRAADAPPAE